MQNELQEIIERRGINIKEKYPCRLPGVINRWGLMWVRGKGSVCVRQREVMESITNPAHSRGINLMLRTGISLRAALTKEREYRA